MIRRNPACFLQYKNASHITRTPDQNGIQYTMMPHPLYRPRAVPALLLAVLLACSGGAPSGPPGTTDPRPTVDVAVSVQVMAFSGQTDEKTLELINRGDEPVEWRVASISVGWIAVEPASGSLAPGRTVVTVRVLRDDLSPGRHEAEIRFRLGPETIPVSVDVHHDGTPVAVLEPATIELGPDDGEGSLRLANEGNAPLEWSLSGPTWVELSAGSGTLPPSEERTIEVSPKREALDAGTHEGELALDSNGGSATVALTVEVAAPPLLALSPGELDFDSSRNSLALYIANDGDRELRWSAEASAGWLSLSLAEGSVAGQDDQRISVSASRSGLAEGTHEATIRIESNGGTEEVRAVVVVPPPAGGSGGTGGGSGEVILQGTVLDQFSRSGVSGVTVTFEGESAVTASDGSFEIRGVSDGSLQDLDFRGSEIYRRRTFARSGSGEWLVIPDAFHMSGFDDMAREYEPVTIRWVDRPRVYLDTTPPDGYENDPEFEQWVDEVRAVLTDFVSSWTNGEVPADGLSEGTSPPAEGTSGWIIVGFSEDDSDYNGSNTVGLARIYWNADNSVDSARIWLRFSLVSGDDYAWARRGVTGHEIGHAMGVGHMDGSTASIMTPSISTSSLTSFDHDVGNVLYTRSPGNASPDSDRESSFRGAMVTAGHGGMHEWICYPDPDAERAPSQTR